MKKIILASSFLIVLASIPLFVIAQWIDYPIKDYTKTVALSMDDSETVFVMVNDNIYHKEKCPLLAGGRTSMPLSSAKARGFKPCPKCLEKSVTIASMPGYKWDFSLVQPTQSKALSYSDNSIDVSFIISETRITFSIQNKTDSGIKINWDDLSFVSPTGRASKIIHSGVKLIDRNSAQAPTTIPPKSRISDIVVPAENIQYVNNTWQEGLLFAEDSLSLSYNGIEFSVYFPLEIKGTKKEYSFTFKISVTQLAPEGKNSLMMNDERRRE